MLAAALVIIAILAGGAYWLVRRQSRPAAAPPPTNKPGGRFGGVEIRARGAACLAARALQGQRFLAKDAPTLPLQGCTFAQCSCTFSKLKDRRTDGRRLDYGTLNASMLLATNRRTKKDRRRATTRQRT